MAGNEPFGFDPEDLDRIVQRTGEQLRGALGKLFDGERPGAGRRPGTAEPTTTGETGDGVWVIYAVNADGGAARIEQVFATELEALRANRHNTESLRTVRFLPFGMPVSVLDAPEESSTS